MKRQDFRTIGKDHVYEFLRRIPDKVPVREPIIDFLHKRRYIPQEVSKEHFSYFTISKVPHLKEILECLDPEHPSTHISIMKSVQAGVTTSIAENAMIYYICNRIGSVLYLMSNQQMSKIRGSSIDVMIDKTDGMVELLSPMSSRNIHAAKRADKGEYKEFIGGIQMSLGSYGSVATMKSVPYVLVIRDEWSDAPSEIKGQGSIDKIIEGRTYASTRYKILSLSTPSYSGKCLIEKSFLQGDQRRWFVPCPYCGCMQELMMKTEDREHGLTFEIQKTDRGEAFLIPESVGYICLDCKEKFFEGHKNEIMQKGEWAPTWEEHPPINAYHRSYHISGLMSPFLSWERICNDFIATNMGHNLIEYHAFCINTLGLAYMKIQEKPNWKLFKEKAEDYCYGEVPGNGELGVFLLGGADVQQDRVEICICAFGEGLECWLVDRRVFKFEEGKQHTFTESAWKDLAEYVYEYNHPVLGEIHKVCIDSRYDPIKRMNKEYDIQDEERKGVVESFCELLSEKFIPIKGVTDTTSPIITSYKKTRKESNFVDTDKIKHLIFSNLYKESGGCVVHFPKYGTFGGKEEVLNDFIFKSFCSEHYIERDDGKMGWERFFRKNEVLDCIVYAFGAAYFAKLEREPHEKWEEWRQTLREKRDGS